MPVIKVLDLTTGHVTLADNELLDRIADLQMRELDAEKNREPNDLTEDEQRLADDGPNVSRRPYGWFVYSPLDPEFWGESYDRFRKAGLSESFIACCKKASELECSYILFDRDANEEDGLAVHEW